jgi:hypothetical protein
MKQIRSAISALVYLRARPLRRCGYDAPVRRFVVILTVLAVLCAAFALAWLSTGWPQICRDQGWCNPSGPMAEIHK